MLDRLYIKELLQNNNFDNKQIADVLFIYGFLPTDIYYKLAKGLLLKTDIIEAMATKRISTLASIVIFKNFDILDVFPTVHYEDDQNTGGSNGDGGQEEDDQNDNSFDPLTDIYATFIELPYEHPFEAIKYHDNHISEGGGLIG